MKNNEISSDLDVNEITVQGSIVGIFSIGRMTILNISTQNAGSTGGKGNKNYPSVVFLNELSTKANSFKKYDNVSIVCHAGYRKRKNPDGTEYFKQGFFADSIEYTKKRMSSLGIDTGGYEDPENKVLLRGEVTSITKTSDSIRTVHMMINDPNSRFKNAVDVVAFSPSLIKYCDELVKGDVIAVLGSIQTKRTSRPSEDGFTYFQNIVASKIKKVGNREYVPTKFNESPDSKEVKTNQSGNDDVKSETESEPKKKVVRKIVRRVAKKQDKEN